MKNLYTAFLVLVFLSCSVNHPVFKLDRIEEGNPYDREARLEWTPSKYGGAESFNFERVVLGYGSGKYGFDSIDVRSDGLIEVIVNIDRVNNLYKSYRVVSPEMVSSLLKFPFVKKCMTLNGRYTSNIVGGTQGFLYMEGDENKFFVWFDNNFQKDFCAVWNHFSSYIERIGRNEWNSVKGSDGKSLLRKIEEGMGD